MPRPVLLCLDQKLHTVLWPGGGVFGNLKVLSTLCFGQTYIFLHLCLYLLTSFLSLGMAFLPNPTIWNDIAQFGRSNLWSLQSKVNFSSSDFYGLAAQSVVQVLLHQCRLGTCQQ